MKRYLQNIAKQHIPTLISFCAALCMTSTTMAQITASGHFMAEETDYPNGSNDPIFYFTNGITGTLRIDPKDGKNHDFTWQKYNSTNQSFNIPIDNQPNTPSSTINISNAGCYKVSYSDTDGTNHEYFAWCFYPAFTSQIAPVEADTAKQCKTLTLEAKSSPIALTVYFHKEENIEATDIDYGFEYLWSSEPEGEYDERNDSIKIDYTAPYKNTLYTCKVTSRFTTKNSGIESHKAQLEYKAVAVMAKFYPNKQDHLKEFISANEENDGSSADLDITFYANPIPDNDPDSLSQGVITKYTWEGLGANEEYGNPATSYFALKGNYTVSLLVENKYCNDKSENFEFKLDVMEIGVPNAFTPFSSYNSNDEFKVYFRSVKNFSMIIFNRWGRKVFETTDPSHGWDGYINGSKADAGVYFYAIEAEGFNNEPKISRKGSVHLIITDD